MIKEFILAWDKNKDDLENYFRTHKQSEYEAYEDLVKLLFDIIINPDDTRQHKFSTEDITVIDHGEYQGTQIFIVHIDTYQPSVCDYVYTNNYYGSCSGCDTLQGISEYGYDNIPDEQQIKDYMALCLGLLQSCVWMTNDSEEVKND